MTSIIEKLSEERKQGQKDGLIPEWYTTQGYQLWKSKYQWKDESIKGAFERIASAAARHTDNPPYFYNKFYQLLWTGVLAPSTPVMANMGTTRGCPVSCSGNFVEDSVYGFYDSVKETAVLSKNGFGTSSYLGGIRHRGAVITKGGTASGVHPVLKSHVQTTRDISQGNQRRGAWAGYLEIDHDDFYEVVEGLLNAPDDKNIGWLVSDSFINRLKAGNEDAITRYQKAMKARCVTGKGYFVFIDKINRANPPMYKEHGLRVKASNLCVAPETLILTDSGYQPIANLEGEKTNIWNGEEWSEVEVIKTGVDQKLIKVSTDSGQELECTPYHKFYVMDNYHSKPREVRACNLKEGDKLIKFDLPIIEGGESLNSAYHNGFFTGDGCEFKGQQITYLYHDKKKLIDEMNFDRINYQDSQNRIVGYTKHLKEKFFVPCDNYDIGSRLEWLAGWLDADGCVYRNGSNEALVGASTELEFLKEVQLMLQTLGVQSKIRTLREEGMHELPTNDGTGGCKEYNCKKLYRLLISSVNSYKLIKLGLNLRRLEISERKPQRDAQQFIKVVDVIDEGRIDDTYCFTEPKRHMGMFGGILTGQCTEVTLHSDEEHTFSCVLSSVNLTKWDLIEEMDAIFYATIFLDCVASEFIEVGKQIRGLEKVVRFTEKGRALGLGALGFHTLLQQKNIPFEDLEAHMMNTKIFRKMQKDSERASRYMAEHWGEPEWCEGFGLRNTHRLAIAPNTSSALLCGSISQGIEPVVENVYTQTGSAGEMERINPVLLDKMKEKGVYNRTTIDDIIENNGSVQHVDWLDEREKLVFKTAFEIDQAVIIRLASVRQTFIDQAQSLNLFFNANEDEAYISHIHQLAFEDDNIKSLYYLRSKAGIQASKDVCLACEG